MKTNKIAFCDFDGTLSRGYISMDFLDSLVANSLYLKKSYDNHMALLDSLKEGDISYDDWCLEWGLEWARGLKDQLVSNIDNHAKEFFDVFKGNIYSSSYHVVELLKEKGYTVNSLSVGASEVIKYAAKNLGMNDVYATELEKASGKYTARSKTNLFG